MCGIAGMMSVYRDGELKFPDAVENMLVFTKHRGPDDTGFCGLTMNNELIDVHKVKDLHQEVKAVFGFNRLSIQDLSMAGHQPMLSPDGKVVLTFNGEIYNATEIRRQLQKQGYAFRGTSDTEVILALYLNVGFEDMIAALNGMFAIVLYDTRLHKLFFARDRFGIIPLYLLVQDGTIIWGSEIKCFKAVPDFKRELDLDALSEAIKFTFPDCVLYKNVEPLEPGIIKIIDSDKGSTRDIRYYDMNRQGALKEVINLADIYDRAEEVIRSCVCRQLISDVNVGVQLSGGIDSTLVAKYVSDDFSMQGKHLYGFSLINSESEENSEERRIDYAASRISIDICKIDMTNHLWVDSLDTCTYAYEKLVNTPSGLGIYQFSKRAKENVTVLLSGEGADELCGGYKEFSDYKRKELISRERQLQNIYSGNTTEKEIYNYLTGMKSGQSSEICKEIFPDYREESFIDKREKFWRGLDGSFFEKHRMMLFRYHLIGLLERQNKICMANSIENRVPFLDNEFVDFILSLPEEVLIRPLEGEKGEASYNFVGKDLLKQVNARIYGHDFAYLRKTNMRVPLLEYMSSEYFKEYVAYHILPKLKGRGLLDADQFMHRFNNLNAGNIMTIWRAINIELWCQNFIDR